MDYAFAWVGEMRADMIKLAVGSTIYNRHGRPVEITGETKVSWIVGGPHSWNQTKIKKSAMKKGNSGEHWIQYFVNEQDALDCAFLAANRYRVGSLVQDLTDGSVLRQIAALIGYQPEVK
jgi:hypothetical protein